MSLFPIKVEVVNKLTYKKSIIEYWVNNFDELKKKIEKDGYKFVREVFPFEEEYKGVEKWHQKKDWINYQQSKLQ